MFNIEWPGLPSKPFPHCPKTKKSIEQQKEELTENLETDILCFHASWCNMSLGPYIRCIECGQESMLSLMQENTL